MSSKATHHLEHSNVYPLPESRWGHCKSDSFGNQEPGTQESASVDTDTCGVCKLRQRPETRRCRNMANL